MPATEKVTAPVTPPTVIAEPTIPVVTAPVTPPVEPAHKAEPVVPASKVPETYTLVVPEGSIHITAADLTKYEAIAREKGLSNEDAQAVIDDVHTNVAADTASMLVAAKADKDYGGAKWDETVTQAVTFLDKVRPKGTPRGDAFRDILDRTGYGNHIEVISLFADLGRMGAEDTPGVSGVNSDGAQKGTRESRMYKS